MLNPKIKADFEKQGYRLVGNHSAVKVCLWVKRAIQGKDVCYKNTFYGIQSHRCVQSSVTLLNCFHRCEFCWRCMEYTIPKEVENPDEPSFILDGLITEQKKYLQGFKGNKNVPKKLFDEAMTPKHVAISLAGDGTLYPKLPGLIDEIKKRKMTSFLVTNGLKPDMLEKLLKHMPTQLYITLPAPNEEVYMRTCKPLVRDGWKRLQKSLSILHKFKRSTIRLTLVKKLNMVNPEQYAEIIAKAKPMFVELKAAMPVGYAQYRMAYEQMPRHDEIIEFAKKICAVSGLKIIDEKQNSRVVLLMKKDKKSRKIKL
ncbi:MAG: 4-demethylwyosine synthase TYW1 [Candidatus Nanoarchaeia archaeon]|nr:4-demethylwyosine synthase TYW1 [Candidatus Nanoarchaeia archaeon]